jgi:hypothetical protein
MLAACTLPETGRAAAPGMNLNWNNCLFGGRYSNLVLACDDNYQTRNLVVSFRLAQSVPDFVGATMTLDGVVDAGYSVPWWQLGAGGCREGALSPVAPLPISGCTNPYKGAVQGGGLIQEPHGGRASSFRIHADWARASPVAIVADTLYTSHVLQLTTVKAVEEGFGTCDGCGITACLVLLEVSVFGLESGFAARLDDADLQAEVFYQIPSPGAGTPFCVTPTRTSTWGAVKALYR